MNLLLQQAIFEAVNLKGSIFMSEIIPWAVASGFHPGEVKGAVDALIRGKRISARPYTYRPFTIDLKDVHAEIELLKRGLPQ